MYRILKLTEADKLKESAFDKAQATLPLDNYHSMGIIVSEDEDGEKMYDVISYYDDKLKGIEDSITSNDWSVITDFAHNKLMNGSYVKIVNTVSGKEKVITPSTYQDEFNGEFTIKPEELTEAEEEIEQNIEDTAEAKEDLDSIIDQEQNQDENPAETDDLLDQQLDELREILVDLDLNLYRIADKEDINNPIYIIGKVADNSSDTLMLVDTKPVEDTEDIEKTPLADEITEDSTESDEPTENTESDISDRFDFVTLPLSFAEINKLNPRWGEGLTPNHEDIVEYLMNCLIEKDPKAAEELKDDEDDREVPQDLDNIDNIPAEENDREEDLDNED